VKFFELFFDLVFVFAITQLAHGLAAHLNMEGAVQTLILLLAVWWAWMYTTWAANWLEPDNAAVRLMLAAVMLAGLIMAAAIPDAFGGRGLAFALPYALLQAGRSAFVAWALRQDPTGRANFIRITAWNAAAGAIWVAGALVDPDIRTQVWIAALVVDYLGPPTRYWVPFLGKSSVGDWNIEGSHMAERCGLFIIIALGESLLVTGATFADLAWTNPLVTGMVAAFVTAVAMWWVYFDFTAEAGSELMAHSDDPGRVGRLAYTYMHLPIVAGIILTAVGDEAILAHPTGDTSLRVALVVLGGPAVFLAGQWMFKRTITGTTAYAHLVAIAVLLGAIAAHGAMSPVGASVVATVVLVAVAVRGWFLHHRGAGTAQHA